MVHVLFYAFSSFKMIPLWELSLSLVSGIPQPVPCGLESWSDDACTVFCQLKRNGKWDFSE